jgi:hypothetical protein
MTKLNQGCSHATSAPSGRRTGVIGAAAVGLLGWSLAASAQPLSASLSDFAYLTTANTATLSPAQFTLEATIRPDGIGYGNSTDGLGSTIIAKPTQGGSGEWIFSFIMNWVPGTGKIRVAICHAYNSSGTYLVSNRSIGIGQSADVAVTFDGTTIRLYIDGVLDSSVATSSSTVYYGANEPVLIGAGNYCCGYLRRFQGLIDDVRIWDRARTASEISSNDSCLLGGAQAGLLANWVFDGSSTADVSGNGRDASFVNTPAYGQNLGGISAASITLQPAAASACPGGTSTFAVSTAGSGPFSYQWRKGGTPIDTAGNPSAATATLTLTNITATDVASYDCVVTNPCGSVTSSSATLTLNCVPFNEAGPGDAASLTGNRPPPPNTVPPQTISVQGLTLNSGSFFGLGSNETLLLSNGSGFLTVGPGAVFSGNGFVIGSIFNAGLVIIPITRAALASQVTGGVIQIAAPTTPTPSPAITVQPQTMVTFTPPPAGPTAINTPSITTSGTARWDGQLDVTGSFTQTETGKLRLFIAGESRGETYSFLNVGTTVALDGELQIVLDPALLGYVPEVGDTFDMIQAGQGITVSPSGLSIRTLMTATGAASLGLSLPTFESGFAADPNQLVELPSNLFHVDLVNEGRTLRVSMIAPVCAPLVGPTPITTCSQGTASFSIINNGSGPFQMQWEVQSAPSGPWQPLLNGPTPGIGILSGTSDSTLLISNVDSAAAALAFRCTVTSPCGTTSTTPVNLTTDARCSAADIVGTNGGPIVCGDSTVDGSDFIAFINSFSIGDATIDPLADIAGGGDTGEDPDGTIDGTDFIAFINAFAIGC